MSDLSAKSAPAKRNSRVAKSKTSKSIPNPPNPNKKDSSDSSDSESGQHHYSLRRTAGRACKKAQDKLSQISNHNSTQNKNNNKNKSFDLSSEEVGESSVDRRVTRRARKRTSDEAITATSAVNNKKSKPSRRRKETCGPETESTTGNQCASSANCLPGNRNTVYPSGTADLRDDMAEGGDNNNVQHADPEIGRLQAMLEARGLPSNLFGSLGPRMQSLLGRGHPAQPNSRISQLLTGITSGTDESHTLQCVIELCDLLVMGNEETLGSHFPIKEVVKALLTCLKMQQNFDIMNNACRALTYLMDALPRSTPVVVEAVPLLIERLHRIECMDVAEHALTALELLSRRHAKNILVNGGICACLQFLDFFSIASQRAALQIASNCCAFITVDELHYVNDSIAPLINRMAVQDKKSVESVCTLFTRLVDNLVSSPDKLMQVANSALLKSIQQLLVVNPSLISTQTFVGIIRMLHVLCSHNTQLAVNLLHQNIVSTLRCLLVGSDENVTSEIELVARTPQEQHEIVVLVGELMPRLPRCGVFEVERIMKRAPPLEHVVWSWKDDRQLWRPYTNIDCRILEAAYQSRETEVSLNAMGNTYTIDMENMMQVNDDTGTSRQVQRRVTPAGVQAAQAISDLESKDVRIKLLEEEPKFMEEVVRLLLPVCYEVYSSSAGPAIRHECIRTILRMICHSDRLVLEQVLNNLPLSSHIANMLSSSDLKLVVGAVQLVTVLLDKIPHVFGVYFRKEGVMHQMEKLTKMSKCNSDSAALKSASDSNLPAVGIPATQRQNNNNNATFGGSTAFGMDSMPPYCIMPNAMASRYPLSRSQMDPLSTRASGGDPLGVLGGYMPPPPFLPPSKTPSAPDVDVNDQSSPMEMDLQQQAQFIVGTPPSNIFTLPSEMTSDNLDVKMKTVDKESDTQQNVDNIKSNLITKSRSVRSSSTASGSGSTMTLSTVITKRRTPEEGQGGGRSSKQHSASASASSSTRSRATSSLHMPATRSRIRQQHKHMHDDVTNSKVMARKVARSGTQRKPSSNSESAAHGTSSPPNSGKKAGAAAYLSDKLSSLPLPKWARGSKQSNAKDHTISSESAAAAASANFDPLLNLHRVNTTHFGGEYARMLNSTSAMSTYFSVPNSSQYQQLLSTHLNTQPTMNKDKVRAWIRKQAEDLLENHFNTRSEGVNEQNMVDKLTEIANNLMLEPCEASLQTLFDLVKGEDLSSFEIIHSGIIAALTQYLTKEKGRHARLLLFAKIFMGFKKNVDMSVFVEKNSVGLSKLVARLNACVSQQQQFPLKVHELPQGPQGSLRGTNALRFFHSHQIKCMLRRHPSCTNLKEWHRGAIKVDSLAQVAAIERYMLLKGYGRVKTETKEDETTDDDNSDDDLEEAMSANSILARAQHRIELLLNDKVLPYDMSLFQAVRHYGMSGHGNGSTDTDTDSEISALNYAAIWVNTHNLWYRLAPEDQTSPNKKSVGKGTENTNEGASKKRWSTGKPKASPKNDPLWNEGIVPERKCPLDDYLCASLSVQITDPCAECLTLLKVLYGLNRHWYALAKDHIRVDSSPCICYLEFVNVKLAAKVNRQLQDPLTVLSQQVPAWIKMLAKATAFILPLQCRQCLLYCTAFDRDRALQHLLDTLPDLNLQDSHAGERITPRLERRKMCIQRTDLLKQAEAVLNNMADGSRAVLEIQYHNEEGTGLGPTLEFYSLVSKELQKYVLELWKGNKIKVEQEEFVDARGGLYPLSLPRCMKSQLVNKTKQKFMLMGKLMARALLDSRMMDVPLSPLFFKWLLGEENTLGLGDLQYLDPLMLKSMHSLIKPNVTALEIESMDLDFTMLSGSHNVELKKGGKDTLVTQQNVNQYVQLIAHWLLVEGVARQMEALIEGFEKVVPLRYLNMFYPEEMEQLFCGSSVHADVHWEAATICACVRPDHGYTHDSQPIKWLVQMMSELSEAQRRRFLQFITGSPRLPVGGFKSLKPPLTVVRKGPVSGEHGDQYLPSVMTCVNYLKLPHYSSYKVMLDRFDSAVTHGQSSFYLS